MWSFPKIKEYHFPISCGRILFIYGSTHYNYKIRLVSHLSIGKSGGIWSTLKLHLNWIQIYQMAFAIQPAIVFIFLPRWAGVKFENWPRRSRAYMISTSSYLRSPSLELKTNDPTSISMCSCPFAHMEYRTAVFNAKTQYYNHLTIIDFCSEMAQRLHSIIN